MSSQLEILHSSIVSCLTAILNGHALERKPAEDELKALEVTEGGRVCVLCLFVHIIIVTEYGLVLARITASDDSPIQYRQVDSLQQL